MERSASEFSISSIRFKELPPLPSLSLPDVLDDTDGGNIELPSIKKKLLVSRKSIWLANAADAFILMSSFLLTLASIVFVAFIFYVQSNQFGYISPIVSKSFSILPRVISTLSLTITSAVVMVTGKRYVLFKFARGGLRSREAAVYSNASIGGLASYLALHGVDLPLIGFLIAWGLALVTGLTVDNSWGTGPGTLFTNMQVPFGPLPLAAPGSSWLTPAIEQLSFVMSSLCLGIEDTVGLVNINAGAELVLGSSVGIIYYPSLLHLWNNEAEFSLSTTMNGFNTSTEQLSSVPSTAQSISCAQDSSYQSLLPLNYWFDGSDNQTLSIIVAGQDNSNPMRLSATAIVMGGTLSSNGSHVEFVLNGTSWPNVMPPGSQWAQDITSLICNTTCPQLALLCAGGTSSMDFASLLNANFAFSINTTATWPLQWSTISNMALGAYTSTVYTSLATMFNSSTSPGANTEVLVAITGDDSIQFSARYGAYVLIVNIVASIIMLIVVARLRLASRLGPDFINSTRLLLDPLRKPELFNASLTETVDALGNPYMLVREDNTFSIEERGFAREGKWLEKIIPRYWHHETYLIEPCDSNDDSDTASM